MRVPVIYEPFYDRDSIWCASIRAGIERTVTQKKYSSVCIDGTAYREYDYDSLFAGAPRLLIIVANRPSWIRPALRFFAQKRRGVVLVDCCPLVNGAVKGQVFFHYEQSIETILSYLLQNGCTRTALYGCFEGSYADGLKQRAFDRIMTLRGVPSPSATHFDNNGSLERCYLDFRQRATEFDSVICTNEIVANSLIKRLAEDGITHLRLVSYGSTKLADCTSTVLRFDNEQLAAQTVQAFRYLYNANNDSTYITVRVSGELVENRSSSAPADTSELSQISHHAHTDTPTLDFYSDQEVLALSKIEKLLEICDSIDLEMLSLVLRNVPYEQISDELHISRSTVFYRLRRIEDTLSVESLADMKRFLRSHHFDEIIQSITENQ